jgi:hypothetical protein
VSKYRLVLSMLLLAMAAALAQAAELPLTRVVLFSSGVGYFEREGQVSGEATVALSFRTAQINDILKSLTLQDLGGGSIAPVTYASQDPLEHTLSSFSIDISDTPRLAEFWNRLRGSRVQVVAEKTVEGIAFGSEQQVKVVDDKPVTFEVLNLLSDDGLMQFPVWQVRSVKLLDPKLDADLHKALAAIDKARATDHKPVNMTFRGKGERKVRIGYLLQTPIWKTTYRLVCDKQGMYLQGWAIVENTTDDDWSNVGLSLVSGRPVSFTQDLYQPLYLRRPEVPVAVAPAASPAVNEGAMERRQSTEAEQLRVGGGGGARGPAGPAGPRAAAPMSSPSFAAPAPPPSERMLNLAESGAAAMAQGAKVGTLFQYAINQPVTIPLQGSAMIPIIGDKVQGERICLYNPGLYLSHPMTGIKLKNTTPLHLMAGPITVFDGSVYAGDALIEDVAPGEERLITYAMDLEVDVERQAKSAPEQFLTAKIVHGVMQLTTKSRMETVYKVKNSSDEKRVVFIEHPFRTDWKLVAPKEADERTSSVYRFRVEVPAGKTVSLAVAEELPRTDQFILAGGSPQTIRLYLQRSELSGALKAALQKVAELQDQLANLSSQRTQREARIKEIEQEQQRIRENMRELDRQGELYKQYVNKLTAQETEFEGLRAQIKELSAQEAARKAELAAYISGLDVD